MPKGHETVLLVEDEEAVRTLAGRVLQSAGYTVLRRAKRARGDTARRRTQETIHLLVTDLVMPRMSGLELASQLMQTRPGIRILLMSGYPNEAAMRHGVPAGASLLQKPFNAVGAGPRRPSGARRQLTREVQDVVRISSSRHRIETRPPLCPSPLTILVVEDHPAFRRHICTALQQRPEFQITEAADGLEAVWKADEFQPDVILLDINLPKLDGFEVAKQVRMLAPGASTPLHEPGVVAGIVPEALSLGAHGYIHKGLPGPTCCRRSTRYSTAGDS